MNRKQSKNHKIERYETTKFLYHALVKISILNNRYDGLTLGY